MKNIINNKGGLHNRLSRVIHLEPLNLNETQDFLRYRGIKSNQKHITEIYMVTGGIPYYLSHVDEVSSSSQIIEEIAFSLNATATPYAWRYTPKQGTDETGAQIDLLFDRNDHAITICEIKYTEQPFVVDKLYSQKLNQKVEIFKKITKQDKQIFLAFISATGLKKTIYSEEMIIHPLVKLDDLFKAE